jgi:N-acetylglutamate synthase-like GNAT family acetyltransferase
MMIEPFAPEFETQVVDLIVSIQRGEFGIDISAEQQPDLRSIPSYYQTGDGNFWVAIADRTVVGTIALLDIGSKQGALRKMFVHRDFRGATHGVALGLLAALLDWAASRGIREVFLGTTPQFLAAHRFYEKNGFTEILASSLPAAFPIMDVDKKFYTLDLSECASLRT